MRGGSRWVSRPRFLAVAHLLVLFACPLTGLAELLVYEPFDYPVGVGLSGKNGGTGFTGPWRNETTAGTATIQSGSIPYPGLNTTGNSVLMSGATGTYNVFRDHANIAGADGTTTWLSFIGQRLGEPQNPPANPNNPYPRGVNISFYNTEVQGEPPRERFALGGSTGGPVNNWAFIGQGQVANFLPASNPAVPFGGGPPAFVVIRIDHHGPPDTVAGVENFDDVYLFVNPSLAGEPPLQSANAKRLGTEPNAFDYSGLDYIRPFIGNTSGASPYGELLWDELRIGTTWGDVVGGPSTPTFPGDTDGDGMPGEYPDDFEPIRANFRKAVELRTQGDLVRDGIVDYRDFQEWKTVFVGGGGTLAEVDLSFSSNVPEPTGYLLAALAAVSIYRITGRRRRG
jgi:hypothetical protein